MESLAVKYRPKRWEDIVEQKSLVAILSRQVELKQFKNAYLFCGATGCGKTTSARIFASMINNNCGSPIEIDAASNNGVDNIKTIIKSAQERALDAEYKIYIIDEAHMLTTPAWNAFLKCIEEPPKYTIFIFCTTEPQKVPSTILNRVQRYNISKISTEGIRKRLEYICKNENFINYQESIDYIAKISNGGMREAITLLDKASSLSSDLNISNVLISLGNYSYDTFFILVNSIIDNDEKQILEIINTYYDNGNDLKLFIDQFLCFCMDIVKYILFQSCDMLKIPSSMEDKIKNSINIDNASSYYMYLVDKILDLKNLIKDDLDIKTTIEILLLKISRCK